MRSAALGRFGVRVGGVLRGDSAEQQHARQEGMQFHRGISENERTAREARGEARDNRGSLPGSQPPGQGACACYTLANDADLSADRSVVARRAAATSASNSAAVLRRMGGTLGWRALGWRSGVGTAPASRSAISRGSSRQNVDHAWQRDPHCVLWIASVCSCWSSGTGGDVEERHLDAPQLHAANQRTDVHEATHRRARGWPERLAARRKTLPCTGSSLEAVVDQPLHEHNTACAPAAAQSRRISSRSGRIVLFSKISAARARSGRRSSMPSGSVTRCGGLLARTAGDEPANTVWEATRRGGALITATASPVAAASGSKNPAMGGGGGTVVDGHVLQHLRLVKLVGALVIDDVVDLDGQHGAADVLDDVRRRVTLAASVDDLEVDARPVRAGPTAQVVPEEPGSCAGPGDQLGSGRGPHARDPHCRRGLARRRRRRRGSRWSSASPPTAGSPTAGSDSAGTPSARPARTRSSRRASAGPRRRQAPRPSPTRSVERLAHCQRNIGCKPASKTRCISGGNGRRRGGGSAKTASTRRRRPRADGGLRQEARRHPRDLLHLRHPVRHGSEPRRSNLRLSSRRTTTSSSPSTTVATA